MSHRMTWPEVICVAVSVLGVAMATAWLVAGNGTLAFLGVVGAGGAWAVYNMLADARESTTVTLRFDPRMLARIKRLARSRYLNYQSMIKQWLSERIEKEGH